jgi:integrase
MATTLTETAIRRATLEAAQQGRRELRDPGHQGLWLRIGKSGTRTWALRARDTQGKPHWFTLGQYPDMGLAPARKAADALLPQIRSGHNPIAARRQQASDVVPTDTLTAVLDRYAAVRGPEIKTWARGRQRIETVFAPLLGRSLASLTAADFQRVADDWRSQQTAGSAIRFLRPVLKWGSKRGYCAKELAEIEQTAPSRQRHRTLSPAELSRLLPVLENDRRFPAYGALFRFILLTATRLDEAAGVTWSEIDLDAHTWTIPASRNKSKRRHELPLSRQAVALLEARKPADAEPDAMIFHNSVSRGLSAWDRVSRWFQQQSGVTGWTRHDLRRTSATMLGELGAPPHIIESVLNHTIHSSLAATYNRSRYRSETRAALQQLADLYDGIAQGEEKVVAFRPSA